MGLVLGLGVGLALGIGWARFYMQQSESARIKASLWRRITRKNIRRQKFVEHCRIMSGALQWFHFWDHGGAI